MGDAFVGRDQDLAVLQSLLTDAARGRLRVGLVQGEAGIGKTTLVQAVLPAARELGFSIVAGCCDELARARPFRPLSEALGCVARTDDPRRDAIATLLEDTSLSAEATSPAQFRIIDSFAELIEETALERPFLLVLEDLHWADVATLTTLRSLSRRLAFLPVGIICTSRPVPVNSAFEGLVAFWMEDYVSSIGLEPLDERAVGDLVAQTVGADPDGSLLGFVAGAAGNPLFIGELIDELRHAGAITVADGRATLGASTTPPTLRLTILRRISYLSEPALDVLRFASVLGAVFSPGDVATVKGEPLTALLPFLEECARAHLIEEQGDRMRFRHDVIREALYEDMPLGVRLALHRHAARALAAAGVPLARVAQQYAVGAEPGDLEAIQTLRRAAVVAVRSPQTRIELLERARSLVEADDALETEVETDLAEALVWGGRPSQGEQRARRLLPRLRREGDLARRMRATLIQALRAGGRWADLAELGDEWLADPLLSAAERVDLLAAGASARASSFAQDVHAAVTMAEEALAGAERLQDAELTCRALIALALARESARIPDAAEAAERAVAIAERIPEDGILRERPHLIHGRMLRDHDAARTAFETGLRLAEERGRVTDVAEYLAALAGVRSGRFEWDEALAEAEAALAVAEEVGALGSAALARAHLTHMFIGRGMLDAAEDLLAAEQSLLVRIGPQDLDRARAHRSMLLEYRGDRRGALELRWRAFVEERDRREFIPLQTLLFLALDLDPGKADEVIGWLEAQARRMGTAETRATARFARGLRELDGDAVSASVAELEAAGWSGMNNVDTRAAALGLAFVGLPDQAAPYARRIIADLEKAGAAAFLERFVAEMRRHGVPIPRRSRPPRPATGWESLTDTERKVAQLAAEGITNRGIAEILFVSPRTVQTHLAHTFRKLGIGRRVELANEVSRQTQEVGRRT